MNPDEMGGLFEHKMDRLKKWGTYLLLLLGTLLIALTMFSLVDNSTFWYLKILNFPRFQVLIALGICILSTLAIYRKGTFLSVAFLLGLVVSLGLQAYILLPYLPASPEAAMTTTAPADDRTTLRVMVANVLMKNRRADDLLKMVGEKDPTLFLAMEVNTWWTDQLSVLHRRYPHRISYPADNAYGMALYSKLPLDATEILFFNQDSVPAFHAKVRMPDGEHFQLLTIHPVPPNPSQYPDNIGEKEVALMKAGKLLSNGPKMPTLAMGDLNDVGWSYNSRRFEALSGLKDLRRGRGMYNTFDAHSWFMRWPLDYIYVSREFKVRKLERLPAFGSDHYPYFAELVLGEK